MRTSAFILALAIAAAACGDTDQKKNPDISAEAPRAVTSIEWIDSVKNLGKINQGQKLQIAFRFRNAGKSPLVIQAVNPSCGCTVADYPKEPIAPGQEAQITGSFDSNGRQGLQHKELTVIANTEGNTEHKLIFEVDIQVPAAAATPQ